MKISRTAFSTIQARVPVVFVGDYGIGKSTVAYNFAKFWLQSKGYPVDNIVRFPLVGALTEDLIGYPEIQIDEAIGKVTVNVVHERVKKLIHGKAVLLLEELNRGDERIQNAIAQLLDGELGQFGKHGEIIVIGTMNEYGKGIYELNENLISRMAFYECTVEVNEERLAIITGKYNTESCFKVLPEDWQKFEPVVRGWMAAFYEHRASVFHPSPNIQENITGPWPNPRAREKLAIPALTAALALNYKEPDDVYEVLSATMGKGFATEFRNWYVDRDYPNPKEVLEIICRGGNPTFKGGVPAFIAVHSEILFYLKQLPLEEAREKTAKVLEYFAKYSEELPEPCFYLIYSYLKNRELVAEIPVQFARIYKRLKEDILGTE